MVNEGYVRKQLYAEASIFRARARVTARLWAGAVITMEGSPSISNPKNARSHFIYLARARETFHLELRRNII